MSLKLLGLMRRASALSIGQDKALPCVKSGKAKLLLLPSDSSDRTVKNACIAAERGHVEVVNLPYTNEEISRALGIESCTVLAITDKGFADALKKSLNN